MTADNKRAEFARRLRELIDSKGMTQSDLARASGVQRDSISNYVRGRRLPGSLSLAKVARALNVAPADLLDVPAAGADDVIEARPAGGGRWRVRVVADVSESTMRAIFAAISSDKD